MWRWDRDRLISLPKCPFSVRMLRRCMTFAKIGQIFTSVTTRRNNRSQCLLMFTSPIGRNRLGTCHHKTQTQEMILRHNVPKCLTKLLSLELQRGKVSARFWRGRKMCELKKKRSHQFCWICSRVVSAYSSNIVQIWEKKLFMRQEWNEKIDTTLMSLSVSIYSYCGWTVNSPQPPILVRSWCVPKWVLCPSCYQASYSLWFQSKLSGCRFNNHS